MKQILTELKGEIECNAFILGGFNTPLTPKDRSTRRKISKETETLNNILEQMDLTDSYRTLHPKAAGCTFFSSAYETFSRIDHVQGHKKNLSKFRKIEIVPRRFSDHKVKKLEINYAKKIKNPQRYGGLTTCSQIINASMTKLKQRSGITWRQMTTIIQHHKICGMQ